MFEAWHAFVDRGRAECMPAFSTSFTPHPPPPTPLPPTSHPTLLKSSLGFVTNIDTHRASLSGTFLQTLPQLVTPLHIYSSVHRRCQPPSKGLNADKTVQVTSVTSEYARKPEARPPRIKREFRLDSNDLGFTCDGVCKVDGDTRNARWRYPWWSLCTLYFTRMPGESYRSD